MASHRKGLNVVVPALYAVLALGALYVFPGRAAAAPSKASHANYMSAATGTVTSTATRGGRKGVKANGGSTAANAARVPSTSDLTTAPNTDHEFDHGSGIAISHLTPIQVENLATLAKVWGFLKYYDPTVTAGKRQWDYSLFRILPAVLKAHSRANANAVLVQWIGQLGPLTSCVQCVQLQTTNLQMRPSLGWIKDRSRLGDKLSGLLQRVYRDRTGAQFYVRLAAAGNPVFMHELPYRRIQFPDSGFQLLALFRFWNIIEYWYPDRNVVGENWDKVLTTFISRLALAKTRKDYALQLMALIAKIHDTHANLWSSIGVRPPVGPCHLPVRIRYVQQRPVITGYLDGATAARTSLRVGDVITKLDGSFMRELVKQWAPYYGASNAAALHRQIATYMTRGWCGEADVGIVRAGKSIRIHAARVPMGSGDWTWGTGDLAGPTFRLLSPQVAYLKLSTVYANHVDDYIKRAAGTRGLIIDIRGYPRQFVTYTLGALLVDRKTLFARATTGDTSTPGAFHWSPINLVRGQAHYRGKVVILVDALTQSQGEFTALAFRSVPGAVVVGSTTAGADGDVSPIPLPGGLLTKISGIGVFHPDKRPTQRVGIVPDVVVKPTVKDIRTGRDPVLEKAIRLIVGPKVPEARIRAMYQANPAQN